MLTVTPFNEREMIRAFEEAIKHLQSDSFVTVGIHEEEGLHSESDGISNAHLGATLHFGTDDGHIPARQWLDVGIMKGVPEYLQIIEDGIKDDTPMDRITNQLGVVSVGAVQQYMTDLSSPANAQSTIDKKGSSNPLIDTGELRASVNYAVVPNEPEEGIM